MNEVIRTIVVAMAWLLVAMAARAQESVDQTPSAQENQCAACHGEADLWDGENARLYVSFERISGDPHWREGLVCQDCHGGDPTSLNVLEAHSTTLAGEDPGVKPFRAELVAAGRAPGILNAQIDFCGSCHEESVASYRTSVHGHGLFQAGLTASATCTDCHGAHGVYPSSDERSPLHFSQANLTCSKCHNLIAQQLQTSVHGQLASVDDAQKADGEAMHNPGCVDCHVGHNVPHRRSESNRLSLASGCSDCHFDMNDRFAVSMHGTLTDRGYAPAATCSECHGAHNIPPLADETSPLSAVHRAKTCNKCHAGAGGNFLDFNPHADPFDRAGSPGLYWTNRTLTWLLAVAFSAFCVHSALWLVRGLVYFFNYGRPARLSAGEMGVRKYGLTHRSAHFLLMASFLGLALTGLPLYAADRAWARALATVLGGFKSAGLWHRIFGLINLGCIFFYAGAAVRRIRATYFVAPDSKTRRAAADSLAPSRRDVRDLGAMLLWFLGGRPKPKFERWTYWEKLDVWAAAADLVLIGVAGMILWLPVQSAYLLPGHALQAANLIHGKFALLATGLVFAAHFFNNHLRPQKFPMDVAFFTGLSTEAELRDERTDYFQRLQREGRLDDVREAAPPRGIFITLVALGALALIAGLGVLLGVGAVAFTS